jgi:hypothetical protein
VIEIMRFQLRPGVEASAFRQADARLQSDFAYRQPGLLRRTTARSADGEWVVVDLWRSLADARSCQARWDGDPAVQAFMALVDASTVQRARYFELDAADVGAADLEA